MACNIQLLREKQPISIWSRRSSSIVLCCSASQFPLSNDDAAAWMERNTIRIHPDTTCKKHKIQWFWTTWFNSARFIEKYIHIDIDIYIFILLFLFLLLLLLLLLLLYIIIHVYIHTYTCHKSTIYQIYTCHKSTIYQIYIYTRYTIYTIHLLIPSNQCPFQVPIYWTYKWSWKSTIDMYQKCIINTPYQTMTWYYIHTYGVYIFICIYIYICICICRYVYIYIHIFICKLFTTYR